MAGELENPIAIPGWLPFLCVCAGRAWWLRLTVWPPGMQGGPVCFIAANTINWWNLISLVNLMSWADMGMPVNPINFSDSYKRATSSPESVQVTQVLFAPASEHPALCSSHCSILGYYGNTHDYIVGGSWDFWETENRPSIKNYNFRLCGELS